MDQETPTAIPTKEEVEAFNTKREEAKLMLADDLFENLIVPNLKESPLKSIDQLKKERKQELISALDLYTQSMRNAFEQIDAEASPTEKATLNAAFLRWAEQMRHEETALNPPLLGEVEADIVYQIAARVKGKGHLPEAVNIYRVLTQVAPTHFSAWIDLAHSLRDTQQLIEAEQIFDIASELFPDVPRIGMYAAYFYLEQGHKEKAKHTLENVQVALRALHEDKDDINREVTRLLGQCT